MSEPTALTNTPHDRSLKFQVKAPTSKVDMKRGGGGREDARRVSGGVGEEREREREGKREIKRETEREGKRERERTLRPVLFKRLTISVRCCLSPPVSRNTIIFDTLIKNMSTDINP